MITKQTTTFDETAKAHDNVDVYDGQKFPEGTTFTFAKIAKEEGDKAMHDFTFKKYGKSTKYNIVLGTTIGDLTLNMLRRQPAIHFSVEDKVEAPEGTLNRLMIDKLSEKIAKERLNGNEPTDGQIGEWAVKIITFFATGKNGVPLADAKATFTVHRVPYYANTWDATTETWTDKPSLKWQIHLYKEGAQIPAKETTDELKARLKEKYGIAIDDTTKSAKDTAATIVPVEKSDKEPDFG